MRSNLAELEESIRKLEELKKRGKNAELVADVEGGIVAVEKLAESKTAGVRRHVDAKVREMEESINLLRSDIATLKSSKEAEKNYQPGADSAKKIMEMKSRMDVLQKYVDGKIGTIDKMIDEKIRTGGPVLMKGGDKNIEERLKGMEEKANSIRNDTAKMISDALRNIPTRNDIKKGIEDVSKYDLDKLRPVADAERALDGKMKLFALNSDVEKVWKEMEGLRRYIDEKAKYADSLGNSLRSWEERSLRLMGREHELDEKLKAFPELKLIDGRIRKLERALVELQRHFVAAQLSGPIIME